ncbi:unnamed protein product [Meloidogyne enterolobii]|uniref:Uncharacterized protein n=1 Tax=Meloidogyne enterolobii TaxID=390850 RepID=A0ACB0ZPB3_MELEN
MPASSAEAKTCTEAIGKELKQTRHYFVKSCRSSLIFISFDSVRRALSNEITFVYSNFLSIICPCISFIFIDLCLGSIKSDLVDLSVIRLSMSSFSNELTIKKSNFLPQN